MSRTVIVYMVADNDLSDDALADIEEMQSGYKETGANLVTLVDPLFDNPYLLKIKEGASERIKNYPEMNTTDKHNMRDLLKEIIRNYPAESYGLILWSHGTSWLPTGSRLRSFGNDRGEQINISDLADALPVHFDFILFDACLMGAVEVAYELRNNTNYIIASSTETIYEGFPYDRIVPELLKAEVNLQAVAQHYFRFYDNSTGTNRSATISLIDTQHLGYLAGELKNLITENTLSPTFDRAGVQRLDMYKEQYAFDLLDFVQQAFPKADISAFITALNRVIIYKAHTPQFLEEYTIERYCGLSCYIPHYQRNDLNEYYKKIQWTKDSGVINLINDWNMINNERN